MAEYIKREDAVEIKKEGEWDMFDLISSAYYGKGMYFKQDNGTVYSRHSGEYMTVDEAIREFISLIDEDNAADAIEELFAELREEKVDNINLTGQLVEEHAKHLWIPVTERLPVEDGRYLTVYWLGTIPNTPWIKTAFFAKNLRNVDKYDFPKKKSGFYDSDSEYGYFEITGVTHWMPLPPSPEPPKEKT